MRIDKGVKRKENDNTAGGTLDHKRERCATITHKELITRAGNRLDFQYR